MSKLFQKLSGGDLRSTGRANEVAAEVEAAPSLFAELFNGLYENDPIIRMRSADVIEKVTRDKPELLLGFNSKAISIMELSEQQEVCWHMAQIASRLKYSDEEERKIVKVLKKYLRHKSKIVRVSAMTSLVDFAEKNKLLLNDVIDIIKKQIAHGSPAVKARGRKLLQRIEMKLLHDGAIL